MNVDLVYDALDNYNNAIKLTYDIDLEIEAYSSFSLGRLQYRALKNNQKAKKHYNYAVRLCEAMKPKIFTETAWHQLMMVHMNEIIQEEQRIEDMNRLENEAEIRAQCQKKLEELNDVMKGGVSEFLKHIVANYKSYLNNELPGSLSEEDLWSAKIKKTLIKLTKHYHPDKINTMPKGTWSEAEIYLRS